MSRRLVESPFEFAPDAPRYRTLSWLILAAGACIALAGLYISSRAGAQLEGVRSQQAKISRQQNALSEQMRRAENNPALLEKIKAKRQLEALLQTPWSLMFEALEAAADTVEGRVTLLSMVPNTANPASRKIELTLMASNYPSMLAYTEALGTVSGFSDVRIVSHQLDERSSPATFRFRLTAGWNRLNEGVFLAKEPLAGSLPPLTPLTPLMPAEVSAPALKPGIGKAPSP
jgi:Tfp pilus assembly protein PilN